MRVSKRALLTHRFASKGDPRYSLAGIRVEADGSTVATDGCKLIRYQPIMTPTETIANQDAALVPFVLPTTAAVAACKLLRGKSPDPAELDVEATNLNGTASFNVGGTAMQTEKAEGSFPAYQNIMPKSAEVMTTIRIGVGHAAEVFGTLKAQGFESVKLSLLEPAGTSKYPIKTAERPILMIAEDGDGRSTVVLMPMRLAG